MTHTDVATANVLCDLGADDARSALGGVLDLAPDLVGLQEWYPGRFGLLREAGSVGLVPDVSLRLRQRTRRRPTSYLWNAPLLGGCAVGARSDRFELLQCRARLLSPAGRSDRPDRWLGIEPPRIATLGVYRDLKRARIVTFVCFHLPPGVQGAGRYREDRTRVATLHRAAVRGLERVIRQQHALGRVVYAVGDSNFDGLRLAGLTSAWDGRESEPGTLGPRRKIDDVFGPGPAESVTLLSSRSDHKAVVVRRIDSGGSS